MIRFQRLPRKVIHKIFGELVKEDIIAAVGLIRTCRICRDIGIDCLIASTDVDSTCSERNGLTQLQLCDRLRQIENVARHPLMSEAEYKTHIMRRYLDILHSHRDSEQTVVLQALERLRTAIVSERCWASELEGSDAWNFLFPILYLDRQFDALWEDIVRDVGLNLVVGRWKAVGREEDNSWKKDLRDQLALNTIVDSTDGRDMFLTVRPRFRNG